MAAAVQTPIDDATFTAFLQRAMPAVRHLLARLCSNADAEDVLQETLAKVWRLRASFDARQNGDAWLAQAAFRCFCDHKKRLRARPAATSDAATAQAPAVPCRTELRDELHHRLRALAPLPRALLLGFHAEGCSLEELAARHGLPLNTVKSHLHRARLRLAQEKP
jgi:RNA polymerase sigma-70 factor (ECF subfamily)